MDAIRSQPGPQTDFLTEQADVTGYGGARGGGKSAAAIFHPMPFLDNPAFGAVIFRRTEPEITQKGGLWEKAWEFYPHLGGVPTKEDFTWTFPSGASVTFGHFQDDRARSKWQGAGIGCVILDEATHFEEGWFWMLLSSNRSTSGIRSHIRMTCNPDPESWVRRFFAWWIADDGMADLSRAGRVRWFIRDPSTDDLTWGDTRADLLRRFPGCAPQTATFYPATLAHNQILMSKDPSYQAKLRAMPAVDRARFLGDAMRGGSWTAREEAGKYFKAEYFPLIIGPAPAAARRVRAWDIAWTMDGDWCVGTRLAELGGRFWVEDSIRFRAVPGMTRRAVRMVAEADGRQVAVRLPHDAGLAAVEQQQWARDLAGWQVVLVRDLGDKVERSKPWQAQCELRNVALCDLHLSAAVAQEIARPYALPDGSVLPAAQVSSIHGWREDFVKEHVTFPRRGPTGRLLGKKDSVDSAVGAFLYLVGEPADGPTGAEIKRHVEAARNVAGALGAHSTRQADHGWGRGDGGGWGGGTLPPW